MKKLEELLKDVPDEVEDELVELIENFLQKYKSDGKKTSLDFSWEGALEHLKDEYTVDELEEMGLKWWKEVF